MMIAEEARFSDSAMRAFTQRLILTFNCPRRSYTASFYAGLYDSKKVTAFPCVTNENTLFQANLSVYQRKLTFSM